MHLIRTTLITAVIGVTSLVHAQHDHSSHAQGVDHRGDKAMGFSHEATKHHFRLFADGGAIEIVPNDPKDKANTAYIRDHLKMIAGRFAAGDFTLPMFIHATKVPGSDVMKARRKSIVYRYETIPTGARVRISTKNAQAKAAIHQFLRFQIKDHRTGDSGKVEKR